jgi:hypothetical protein
MMSFTIMTHCPVPMRVERSNQKYLTMDKCPQGYGPGLEPLKLLEKCMNCPKKTSNKRRTRSKNKGIMWS